ncbi:hypothetical protein [Streptomyces cucumeris]|uniref:hypothetical protein n=1 Tax=Streptomyces cucumeris TaxID=2962890 RepID=UPI0020C83D74|nr:hypothetical protein [Streptomyces sp. NEAU-Y11]MCP9210368.1 hypothetical protein [Streptomyces sp. NEAU-Y11]
MVRQVLGDGGAKSIAVTYSGLAMFPVPARAVLHLAQPILVGYVAASAAAAGPISDRGCHVAGREAGSQPRATSGLAADVPGLSR